MLALKWQHIDFNAGTMLVHSAKTERHKDGGQRLVPLFAELRPLLLQAFTEALEGAEYVIGKSRDGGVNRRTQAERIIERAGVPIWPKLFVNLRASRATELANQYPGDVCAAWLGHTEAIADEFYRQVTGEDFQRAVGEGGAEAARNPANQADKLAHTSAQPTGLGNEETPVLPGFIVAYDTLAGAAIPPRGVEPRRMQPVFPIDFN